MRTLFERAGDRDALAEAITLAREAAARDRSHDARYLSGLGILLLTLYEQTAEEPTLAEAIALQREALAITPGDPAYLTALGITLATEFERSADLAALTEAVNASREAILATPDGDPDRAERMSNFSTVALQAFQRTGEVDVLTEAVTAARAAAAGVAAVAPGTPEYGRSLSNLCVILQVQYEQTTDLDVLAEAVAAGRSAAAVLGEDDRSRAACLSNLGTVLQMMYARTGDMEVLTEAVAASRACVAAASGHHYERAKYLSNLGVVLVTLYGRTGDPQTLREAVEINRAAAAVATEEQPGYAMVLSGLGAALQITYLRTGELGSLAEALDVARKAVAAAPVDDPDRARHLSNLAIMLDMLYDRTWELDVLTQGVAASRAAVTAAAAARTHYLYGLYLSNLGHALVLLYRRTRHPDVLSEAEQVSRAASDIMNQSQPHYVMALSNLAAVLHLRFAQSGSTDALTEAVIIARQAVAASPVNDPARAQYLSGLCVTLNALSEQDEDAAVLAEAVEAGREATAIAEASSQSDYVICASNLGISLRNLFSLTRDPETLTKARAVLVKAVRSSSAPVSDRILAGLELARADTMAGDDRSASATMEGVMRLLLLAIPGDLHRQDAEYRLGELSGIAEYAAATALSVDDQVRAVVLLEQARGQLLAEAMDARLYLSRLRAQAPDLAGEFELLRARLSSAGIGLPLAADAGFASESAGASWQPQIQAIRQRFEAAPDDSLLDRIRALPGLADFFAVPSISQLSEQAAAGPVILVTAAWNRSDALILTPDPDHPVRHVPLPDLTQDMVYKQADRFVAARHAASDPGLRVRQHAQRELHEILAWLWDTAAGPILADLGYHATPEDDLAWPRLWWCPVGTLAYLPLHAAGHHHDRQDQPRTVLDRVISSYTATIRALAYSRQALPAASGAAGTNLIVAMPHTPEAPSLPGIAAEAQRLARLLPDAQVLQGRDATHDNVLAALPGHRVAHFACHGISDWNDPGRSRLLLHDHLANPLTVGEISRQHLAGADLAYLSACSTTDTSPRLADQAVHITAAFQLAGYRNVIGTLWPVNDAAATQVAEDFYRYLTSDGTQPPDTGAAALSLHRAIRLLRSEYAELPARWAAHIHTGI